MENQKRTVFAALVFGAALTAGPEAWAQTTTSPDTSAQPQQQQNQTQQNQAQKKPAPPPQPTDRTGAPDTTLPGGTEEDRSGNVSGAMMNGGSPTNTTTTGTTSEGTTSTGTTSTGTTSTGTTSEATTSEGTTGTMNGYASPGSERDMGGSGSQSPGFLRRNGLSLSVGGGVLGFTDQTMRDTTKVGGLWDVRVGLMTNRAIGLEVAYEGGLQAIDALGLDTDAQLLSTELEALARVNFLTGRWTVQPYVFAGGAWKRYELRNVATNLSDVNDQDDVLEIPVGLGLGYRMSGFLVDVRGTFRPALDADLVPTDNAGDKAAMHAWSAALRLGYAF